MRQLLAVSCTLVVAASGQDVKREIQVPGWPSGGKFPLSTGIVSHGMVLASGMVGIDFKTMKPVTGGVQAETKQALSNIAEIMKAGGSDMDHVVGCQVFVPDLANFAAVNEVYATFFQKPYPTRVAVQVGALAGNASVEIKCSGTLADGPRAEEVKVPGWFDLSAKVPLSAGVVANGFVFASGLGGADMRTGKMVEGGIEAETRQAMTNIRELFEAGGSSMADVVDCAVYLINAQDFPGMNKAYGEFFSKPFPSRVSTLVPRLAGPASVEIQCFAALPSTECTTVVVPSWPDMSAAFPLSWGSTAGGLLFASGLQGFDFETRKVVPGGVEAETHQTLTLLKQLVEAGGSSMADVVECAVFLTDMKDFMAMNQVYAAFFPKPPPARVATKMTVVGGAAVEIQCTAAMPAAGGQHLIVV